LRELGRGQNLKFISEREPSIGIVDWKKNMDEV